jgi:hypothetical protein
MIPKELTPFQKQQTIDALARSPIHPAPTIRVRPRSRADIELETRVRINEGKYEARLVERALGLRDAVRIGAKSPVVQAWTPASGSDAAVAPSTTRKP